MASKLTKNQGAGDLKKSHDSLLHGIGKQDASTHKKSGGISPVLMPEKIKVIQRKTFNQDPIDLLDMKSKKIIETIGQNIHDLANVNPLQEGGFGLDHPAVKNKTRSKKNADSYSEAEVIEDPEGYQAVLKDLRSIMEKLAANRKQVFNELSKK